MHLVAIYSPLAVLKPFPLVTVDFDTSEKGGKYFEHF